MGGAGLGEEREPIGRDVGVDAAPVVGAEVAREQSALFKPGDQASGGALAEDDGVRDLVHPQMAARSVVLLAERHEDRELPDAEIVPGL